MGETRAILGLSTKFNGNMRLADSDGLKNRQLFFQLHGLDYDQQAVSAGLQHETNVVVIKEQRGRIPNCDSLITKETGVVLCVAAGDCIPVYFRDEGRGIIGMAHAGWRGLLKGIIPETIAALQKLGANVDCLRVTTGPHIQKCHFTITEELLPDFSNYSDFIEKGRNGYNIDLRSILFSQLLENGLNYNNIAATTECTFCRADRYFSFRRDRIARNFLAFIWQNRF
ncbi:MAG TPA: peptidoglycan editing factor PgeF [bacterium]|nr:peptidoglycan editing factor PgeF [bacterium]